MYKHLVLTVAFCLCSAVPVLAQQTHTASSSTNMIGGLIGGVLMLLGALWMLGHMIYILLIRKKFRTDLTVADMEQARRDAGLSSVASDQDNAMAYNAMQDASSQWATFYDNGEECSLPLERSAVKNSAIALETAYKCMPTDPEIIDLMNDMGDVVNGMRKRTFTASKTLLVILWIAVVLMGWGSGNWGVALTFGAVWSAIYGMASMKPDYVLIRKELEGKEEKSFLTGIIAGLFGAVAAAPTYRTITTYSDGHKETSDDNSPTFIALIFGLFVMIVMVIIMPVFAAINYLRNYVFA